MKIKVVDMPYEQALAQPREKHTPPRRPSMLFRALLRALSAPDLRATHFRCDRVGMERLGPDEPCLVLMNHSCFLDLKIAAAVLYPRPFNIVCTSDGFVGKAGLMRALGCIPTRKFQPDTALVRDMLYAVKKLKSSILLYPEASYSFDGTATPLPVSLGKCVKALGVPVVLLRTCGAFARDPLYNGLQNRRVNSGTLPEESSFYLSIGHPIAAVCIRTSTERPEALEAGDFILAGITTRELLNATDMAIEMKQKGVLGKPCPDYVDETVSMKVVRIIQGYVNVVNKMVWRKY